jgi:hypothetical protein
MPWPTGSFLSARLYRRDSGGQHQIGLFLNRFFMFEDGDFGGSFVAGVFEQIRTVCRTAADLLGLPDCGSQGVYFCTFTSRAARVPLRCNLPAAVCQTAISPFCGPAMHGGLRKTRLGEQLLSREAIS